MLLFLTLQINGASLLTTTVEEKSSRVVEVLLGFGMWASIYAVAGALVTSADWAQSASGPIGFTAAAVYMAVLIGVVPNPDGMLARVLSFLPPSAPFAIPARAASGIPVWEVVVGAVLTGLGTLFVVRLAGRLYSTAVLSGGRLTWRSASRAEPIR